MLELHHVCKAFGERRAVDDVSMTVGTTMLTGFVGANGAGKSTAMRLIMGLLELDGGAITWDGDPLTAAQRRRFGYMPEERGLYPKQRVRDQLIYFARLHKFGAAAAARRADELLEAFGLADRGADRLEALSLGNQQRVQIAVALLHDPDALILDEPFSGLDPDAVDTMAELIRTYAGRGVPVLFSSHQLDLVERLCDELVIIAKGQVVAAGSIEKLRARQDTLLRLDSRGVGGWIGEVDGISCRHVEPDTAQFVATRPGAADDVLRRAVSTGTVTHYGEVERPLSDIYREAVQ